jgi:hypothetical protein
LVVNKVILENEELTRIFQKARIKEIKRGAIVSQMIDGQRILESDNFLNIDVKKQILDLVNELKITKELEAEELKKKILSTPSLALLISDCIRLSRKRTNEEMEKWLMNELYGYKLSEEFNNKHQGRKIEEVISDLPNNPQYRILRVKLRFQFSNRFEELDYPFFWTKPIGELENIHNDLQEDCRNKLCMVKLPLETFPKEAVRTMKKHILNLSNTIPAEISRNEIANCINDLLVEIT